MDNFLIHCLGIDFLGNWTKVVHRFSMFAEIKLAKGNMGLLLRVVEGD